MNDENIVITIIKNTAQMRMQIILCQALTKG